ncbi:NAD-dependent epimerase/dehydratase family protein [Actinoplanes sp. NPDC049118]|uniref:NAD-dependent epimerase/dehydratase family protein n=1 Tax=Actinoplanes sp. NPDC049118 TaxID=3155769 RepID=UPI0033C9B51E
MPDPGGAPAGIRLSATVMAHPSRLRPAREVLARAPGGLLGLTLDPEPDGPPTALRTAMLAWSGTGAEDSHRLVLQDDALFGPGFLTAVRDAVAAQPRAALAFYTNWNSRNGAAVRLAVLSGASWARATAEYTPSVALALPAEVARGFEAFGRRHGGTWQDDVIMARYLRERGVPTLLAAPNLVEHDALASLNGHDFQGLRRSACPPGPPGPPPGGPVASFAVVPFFKQGISWCATRMLTGERLGWETVTGERQLSRLGLSELECRAGYAEAVAGLRADPAGTAGVGEPELWGVWLTAYLMGVLVGGGEVPAELADRALATIGPGGLCERHDLTAPRQLAEVSLRLARAAVSAGTQARPAARRTAARRLRIVVLGGRGFPGRRLVRCLADAGHHLVSVDDDQAVEDHPGVRSLTGDRLAGACADADVIVAADGADVPRDVLGGARLIRIVPGEQAVAAPPAGVTVLRAGTAYGPGMPGGTMLPELVRRCLIGMPLPRPPDGAAAHRLVHVDDLAAAVLAAAGRDGVFVASAPPLSGAELAEGVRAAVRPVPISDEEHGGLPVPAAWPAGRSDRWDWRARVPLIEGIRTYAQWFAYES